MKIFYSLDEISQIEGTGVALGNFDGVHIGHQKLINNTIKDCKELGLSSIIFTFLNHPRNVTYSSDAVKNIVTWQEKTEILQSLGVDYLAAIEFDDTFRKMSPKDFVKKVLLGKLNMKAANCGFHYRFGHKAMGDTALLEEMSKTYGFKLSVLDPVRIEGTLVSSTKIRELIAAGKMEMCREFLGRRYTLEGNVIQGKQYGKKMGFPTANILVSETRVIPPNGVYITKCFVDNKRYNSITNIGYNPTVGGERRSIETYIMDFDGNIYEKHIKVEFYKHIRGEVKFENVQCLKEQISMDVHTAKMYYNIK